MRADAVIKRAKSRRRERGAALVMVLLAIVVLTVFLTDVQQQSSSALSAAIAERDRLKAEYHARSAINLSRLLLALEPTVRRAVSPMFAMLAKGAKLPQIPVWEFSDGVLGAYNCPEHQEAFAALAGVDTSTAENIGLGAGQGCFEVVIVDEDAKLNVNTAARGDVISRARVAAQLASLMMNPQYNPLFEVKDLDGQLSDRQAICGALIDWADSDEELEACDPFSDNAGRTGVEDNYYQTIGLPYLRKNAAFDSLEELRLVRGVGDDFWATFVDPEPSDPKKRIMTVWGQGKVNVNTANAQTLLALICAGAPDAPLCLDMTQAATFLQVVSLAKAFTAGAPLFKSPKDFIATMKGKGLIGPQMAAMGIEPVVFKSEAEMAKMISTQSKMFSIYAEGVIPSFKRETRVSIQAVIDFRSAKDLSEVTPPGTVPEEQEQTKTPAPSGAGADQGELDPALDALLTNPAGNIVYWRVQ